MPEEIKDDENHYHKTLESCVKLWHLIGEILIETMKHERHLEN